MEFDPVLVHEWLRRTARRFPQKTALVFGQDRWTYQKLEVASDRLARRWRESGLRRGDQVAIFLENSVEIVVCLYAALKAGGIFVVLDPALPGVKLGSILEQVRPIAFVTHVHKANILRIAFESLSIRPQVLWVGRSEGAFPEIAEVSSTWEDVFDCPPEAGPSPVVSRLPPCIDVDLACLISTSGSTGEPKGIMSTHRNVVSSCRSIIQYLENQEEDTVLCALPLSFDYGLYQVLMASMFGGTVILERGFVYPHPVLEQIGREKVTGFPIVPSILAIMLRLKNLPAVSVGQEPKVTYPDIAGRQDMKKEPADKLVGLEGHSLLTVMVGIIPPGEGDLAVSEGEDVRAGGQVLK